MRQIRERCQSHNHQKIAETPPFVTTTEIIQHQFPLKFRHLHFPAQCHTRQYSQSMKKIVPGSAERILVMAEQSMKHQHEYDHASSCSPALFLCGPPVSE
ncbi:DUF2335 domain-containing protein [Nitrosomonas halophila]|uniref:DUF2335 domain-containing protein n=1 Tax=Nitrosomonas halophila TaxID=44576 RepID=UPI000B8A58D9